MDSELKKALINKTQNQKSPDFDAAFFEKLEKVKNRPKVFSGWLTWAISGCATLCVLFIAVTSYNTPVKRTFNHSEYINSAIEIQNSLNEDVSVDDLDLTSKEYDEI